MLFRSRRDLVRHHVHRMVERRDRADLCALGAEHQFTARLERLVVVPLDDFGTGAMAAARPVGGGQRAGFRLRIGNDDGQCPFPFYCLADEFGCALYLRAFVDGSSGFDGALSSRHQIPIRDVLQYSLGNSSARCHDHLCEPCWE